MKEFFCSDHVYSLRACISGHDLEGLKEETQYILNQCQWGPQSYRQLNSLLSESIKQKWTEAFDQLLNLQLKMAPVSPRVFLDEHLTQALYSSVDFYAHILSTNSITFDIFLKHVGLCIDGGKIDGVEALMKICPQVSMKRQDRKALALFTAYKLVHGDLASEDHDTVVDLVGPHVNPLDAFMSNDVKSALTAGIHKLGKGAKIAKMWDAFYSHVQPKHVACRKDEFKSIKKLFEIPSFLEHCPKELAKQRQFLSGKIKTTSAPSAVRKM